MSRSIGTDLPPPLLKLLDGDELAAKEGVTLLLLTTTGDGWPHVAMLSVGELLALDRDLLRVALWPSSTATRNLSETGQTTISVVHEGVAYYVRCKSSRRDDLGVLESDDRLACFDLRVANILEDVVPYAKLTSGITFQLADGPASAARWASRVTAMRDAN